MRLSAASLLGLVSRLTSPPDREWFAPGLPLPGTLGRRPPHGARLSGQQAGNTRGVCPTQPGYGSAAGRVCCPQGGPEWGRRPSLPCTQGAPHSPPRGRENRNRVWLSELQPFQGLLGKDLRARACAGVAVARAPEGTRLPHGAASIRQALPRSTRLRRPPDTASRAGLQPSQTGTPALAPQDPALGVLRALARLPPSGTWPLPWAAGGAPRSPVLAGGPRCPCLQLESPIPGPSWGLAPVPTGEASVLGPRVPHRGSLLSSGVRPVSLPAVPLGGAWEEGFGRSQMPCVAGGGPRAQRGDTEKSERGQQWPWPGRVPDRRGLCAVDGGR